MISWRAFSHFNFGIRQIVPVYQVFVTFHPWTRSRSVPIDERKWRASIIYISSSLVGWALRITKSHMGSNVPLTPTMRFATRSASTRRKRKRIGVYTVSGLPALITHISQVTPGFARCNVLLAICLMYILRLDRCYALLPVKSHRKTRHAGQIIDLKVHIANPRGIWLRSARNDNIDNDGRA